MPAPGCRDFRSSCRGSRRRSGRAPNRGSILRAVASSLPRYAGWPPAAITGIDFCCARRASGHATAAPPARAMNSRRRSRRPLSFGLNRDTGTVLIVRGFGPLAREAIRHSRRHTPDDENNAEAEEGAAPGGRTSRRRSLLRLAEYSRPGLILRLTREEDVSCRDDRALTLPTLDPVDPGSGAYPFAIKRSCRDARVRVTRRRRGLDSNF